MIRIDGFFYDGKSSKPIVSHIIFYESGRLCVNTPSEINSSIDQIQIMPRIGNTPRYIVFPDGSKFETNDNKTLDQISAAFRTGFWSRLIHKVEINFGYLLLTLAAVLPVVWLTLEYGIPYAAKSAANKIPASIELEAGINSLDTLDRTFFKPTQLPQKKIEALGHQFQTIAKSLPKDQHYEILFRSSPELGANAFTLPGGLIVVTDGLVQIAENEQQILAVISHEIGHIYHRHSMRSLLQNSVTALLLVTILGDVNSISAFAATIPALLLQSHYSRGFELEADEYASQTLKKANIPASEFAKILLLLSKQNELEMEDYSYLSSHPATQLRIERIQNNPPE